MIRCKIRKHTKAVAVLILCVAVCIILIAAFGGERKIPFFGTWRIEREVIIPELTPELTSGMPLEEAMKPGVARNNIIKAIRRQFAL